MMTAANLKTTLTDAINTLKSDYTPEQWANKEEIDMSRYTYAKDIQLNVREAIDSDSIDWNDCSTELYEELNWLTNELNMLINNIEQ